MRTNAITQTNGEINPDGPYQAVVSGNNLIYAYNDSGTLRIKYGDIKTGSAIDPETIITNGTQSYSKAGIWTGVDNSDRWIVMIKSAETANYIHCCFWTGNAGAHTLHYIRSTNDGVTFAIDDEAFSPEDAFEVSDNQQIFNVTHINGVPYCIVYDQSIPRLTIYDVTDFSIVLTSDFRYTSGHYNEIDDEFKIVRITVNGSNYEIRLFAFDGSTLTEEQEIDLLNTDVINANECHLSYCVRNFIGNSLFLFIKANASVLTYIRPGNGIIISTWYTVSFSGTPAIHLSWSDFSYMTLDYFHLNGSVDSFYKLTDKGYIIKISHDATETVSHGILWYMYPYNFVQSDQGEFYNSKLIEKHLEPARLTLENIGEEYVYQRGDGITVFDSTNKDGEIFYGEYEESESDLEGQFVKFVEPSINDLDKEITVQYIGKTVSEMLIDVLENHCIFLFHYLSSIDSTVATYNISWKNTKIKEIFKWFEEREFKIIYWESRGLVYFNDGSGVLTSLLENNGQTGSILQGNLGKNFDAVLLRGGLKQDGTLARILVISNVENSPELNIFTVDVPQMIDDDPNGEMDLYGQKLLSNRDSAFTGLKFEYYEHTKVQIGEGTLIVAGSYGINQNYIIYHQFYFPEENTGFIKKSYSGIFNKINDKETLSEANREILGQVAEELNNISQIGSIYYLDSAVSDIGGYKKMLLTYTSAIEEDISVIGAVDGDPIEEFATEPNEPGITELIGGIYSTHIHASKTTGIGTKDVAIYFEMYKRASGGSETLLGTSHSTEIFQGLDNLLSTHLHLEDQIILATDRIVIKYYVSVTGNGAAPDIEMHIQGDTTSRFIFPFNIPSSSITDPNAIHVNVASEITAITEVTVPTSIDEVLIEDESDSDNKKSVKVGNLAKGMNHDDVANPNGNANEQHLTAAQVTALHAIYTDSAVIAALTALGLTLFDTGTEFKLNLKDKNSADVGQQYVDGVSWIRDLIGATLHTWKVATATKMDLSNLGLQLGGTGARISVFDTSALATTDTKVPTNTTVKEYADKVSGIESANAEDYPCIHAGSTPSTAIVYSVRLQNTDGTDFFSNYVLGVATNKGSEGLYLTDLDITLTAASGTSYINEIRVYGDNTLIHTDTANKTTATTHNYTLAEDVSSYRNVLIWIRVVANTTPSSFQMSSVTVTGYYT